MTTSPGPGHGYVDEFSLDGQFAAQGRIPRGSQFSLGTRDRTLRLRAFSHDLLVGNFGDGTINVFDPKTDHFLGKLRDSNGAVVQIDDLWALHSRQWAVPTATRTPFILRLAWGMSSMDCSGP